MGRETFQIATADVRAVLLSDNRWYVVKPGTFAIGPYLYFAAAGEKSETRAGFRFNRGTDNALVAGPLGAVVATSDSADFSN